jgi:hypothetical protein
MTEPLIVAVIKRYQPGWEPPPENGYEWVSCLCPFHDDSNKSASVSYSRNAFHCFACPVKGDAVAMIREQEGVNYAAAFKLAETISGGSYQPVSRKPARQSRRFLPEEQGLGIPQHQNPGGQVQVGVRGRTSPWT